MRNSNFNKLLKKIDTSLGAVRQSGGGLTTDVGQQIAGQPVYQSYLDCAPPAILGGRLSSGASCKPMCGGSKRKGKKTKRSNKASKKKSIKKSIKKKKRLIGKRTKHRKSTNPKPTKRNKKKNKKKKSKAKKTRTIVRHQNGGMAGEYPFKGDDSVLGSGMDKRTFNCNQPNWDPSCT